ncbi:ABC transporter permease [Clostridium akagii]|uniref:ABC transporter permease n=1 Tax=Clostridium akagii TaxID=91623 RepID=UPI00047EEF58|nr:ABC transporter permease [Clostridium akagii]
MNKLLHLFLLDTKLLLKSKVFYFKLVLFPVAIILILGSVFNSSNKNILKTFNVAYYSEDTDYQSLNLSETLRDDVFKSKDIKKVMNLEKVNSYAKGKELVSNGTAAALVYVPNNFTKDYLNNKKIKIGVLGDNSKSDDVLIVKTILNSFDKNISTMRVEQDQAEDEMKSKTSISKEDLNKLVTSIEDTSSMSSKVLEVATRSNAKPLNMMQYEVFAITVMFSIITAFELTHNIVSDKLNNTMNRIKSTPTSNFQYILGKIIGIVIAIVVQMITVIVVSGIAFNVKYNNVPEILLITVVYGFTIGSIVVCAGILAKDHMAVSSVMAPILWGFSFLGGSLFNKNSFPYTLGIIQKIIPNGKAVNCYLGICEGNGINFIYKDIFELLGMTVIFVLIALILASQGNKIKFRSNKKSALMGNNVIK